MYLCWEKCSILDNFSLTRILFVACCVIMSLVLITADNKRKKRVATQPLSTYAGKAVPLYIFATLVSVYGIDLVNRANVTQKLTDWDSSESSTDENGIKNIRKALGNRLTIEKIFFPSVDLKKILSLVQQDGGPNHVLAIFLGVTLQKGVHPVEIYI